MKNIVVRNYHPDNAGHNNMRYLKTQWWARKFKKVQAKKNRELKEINFKKYFLPNSIFCNFINGQKSIFEMGKKFKTGKNSISFDLFDFTSYFAWTFLIFMASCAKVL